MRRSDKSLRIVYMGTPEFAVPSLDVLVDTGYEVVGVVTAPDKPAGRGLSIQESAVKQAAKRHDLHILQPTNLKDPAFLQELQALHADLQIVVAFRMLPEVVWDMPPLGTFNLHGSLLPNYRGAAPIHWAIINGEKETGVTTFFLKHAIDTGDIVFQERDPINQDDTVGTVYERLRIKGAQLVLKTVEAIESGETQATPQVMHEGLRNAPKIRKSDCEIPFERKTEEVHNFIRGLSPYPTAFTKHKGKSFKIYRASLPENQNNALEGEKQPGHWFSPDGKRLLIGTADGAIQIDELQPAGKKRISADAFLRGYAL